MMESTELRDRLSELPDSLILRILSLLPIRNVVRTTILSKRWKGLWTSVPSLIFDAENKSSEAFCSFVNRAMLRWKGTKLQRFSLNFYFSSLFFTGDVDTWLRVAIEKGVEELSVDLERDLYSPPQSLYSCSTIRKASLAHCCLDIKGKVQWSRLTSLKLELQLLGEGVLDKILSGAPLMEILILSYVDFVGLLNIKSESLKRLKVERKSLSGHWSDPKILTVGICTPNIETLEISGIPCTNYGLMNVSSLTSVEVSFINHFDHSGVHRVLMRDMLVHFLANIHHPEKVTLSGWFVKVLREIKKESKFIAGPLSDVKFLRLYAARVDDVVDILELFPALTVLIILQEPGTQLFFNIACPSTTACISEFDAEESLQPKSDILMPYLRTVEITWAVDDDSIFSMIEFLLENVRKLEKMVLRVTGIKSAGPVVPLLLASQRLLSVQKAFPSANVILCHD